MHLPAYRPARKPTSSIFSKNTRVIKAGSHNLHYHINDLNTGKKPSPAVTFEPQTTCSLGMHHKSHTLTMMGSSYHIVCYT